MSSHRGSHKGPLDTRQTCPGATTRTALSLQPAVDSTADDDAVLDVHKHVSITDYSVNLKREWLRIQSPVLTVVGRQELNGCTKPPPQRLNTARRVTGITVRSERCGIDRISHLDIGIGHSVNMCHYVHA